MDASVRWSRGLAAWAVPPELLAAAPVSPWGFDVATFRRAAEAAEAAETPSRRRSAEALGGDRSVLDVGCGGGAGSLPLRPALAVGVDESPAMLAVFAERAAALGVPARTVAGRWPDVAAAAGAAEVAVCHHVVHNVPDLAPFAAALTAAARRRVVVEMSVDHPMTWLRPVWRRVHGLDRPVGPTVDDAVAVLAEVGVRAEVERWDGPSPWGVLDDDLVAMARRRVCVGPERDDEVRAALEEAGLPAVRPLATLWWPGAAP